MGLKSLSVFKWSGLMFVGEARSLPQSGAVFGSYPASAGTEREKQQKNSLSKFILESKKKKKVFFFIFPK
jgi:hypothetical protein